MFNILHFSSILRRLFVTFSAYVWTLSNRLQKKVEKESERLDEILIERKDSISRENLLKYIRFRGIEFEERRNTPRDYFTNTRRNFRDTRK